MTRNVFALYALCALTLTSLLLIRPALAGQAPGFAPFSDFPDRSPLPSAARRAGCSAASAHGLIGQPLNDETRRMAQARSGASSSRVVRIGAPRDLSLAPGRLSIEVDAIGVISAFNCE